MRSKYLANVYNTNNYEHLNIKLCLKRKLNTYFEIPEIKSLIVIYCILNKNIITNQLLVIISNIMKLN